MNMWENEMTISYWEECIFAAFNTAGIQATKDQVNMVAGDVEVAHENYGMAHGHDTIPNPLAGAFAQLKQKHEIERNEWAEREICYKKSVAARRNVRPEDVYLENGYVFYNPN